MNQLHLATPTPLQFTFALSHTAWYMKQHPTFADALAFVRRYLWASRLFQISPDDGLESRSAWLAFWPRNWVSVPAF